ncbi:hypothetical protein roselon_02591 [Roseibacterium elongatum DSM 19469]|uniref:Uncharacterized protein n=1 Tax=Roseicyclus elongatus DSM 19469 TaxID=1294273 RepID=W8RUP8_9RHOB|nr:hypothetical protein [Roseibacterium elongatum]AHM04909.1 hypothetical protein roselon_02591 [Roseibacterium elongatum DSM 19469]
MRLRFLPPSVSANLLAVLIATTATIPTHPGTPSMLEALGTRLFSDAGLTDPDRSPAADPTAMGATPMRGARP